MGTLFYGASRTPVLVHDHTLVHLRALTSAKFRRRENFMLSWDDVEAIGDGASSVWLHSEMDLHFKFDGKAPKLERHLLDTMIRAASSSAGLQLADATLPWDPQPDVDEAVMFEFSLADEHHYRGGDASAFRVPGSELEDDSAGPADSTPKG